MPWIHFESLVITQEWTLTASTNAEIFRLTHSPIFGINQQYLKAVIASAHQDQDITIFEPRRLSYRNEKEIFYIQSPATTYHSLGLKRLDNTGLPWLVQIEAFETADASLNQIEITKIVEEVMTLYSRGSGLVPQEPNSVRSELNAGESKKVLDANSRRRNLKIINGSNTVLVFGGAEVNNIPQKVIITLLPNEVFDFPINNGLYMGEIWIKNLTSNFASVGLTEFNVPQ